MRAITLLSLRTGLGDPAVRAVAILAVTQILGWATTFNSVAVVAPLAARDLGLPLAWAFGALTVFLTAMAVVSPRLGVVLALHGARRILAAGSALASAGLVLLAMSPHWTWFFAAWTLLGVAGAACLSTAANTLLVEVAGRDAKRLMVFVMLASGLSSTASYPVTAALADLGGWRSAYAVYAAVHLLICLPLHWLAPDRQDRAPVIAKPITGDAAHAFRPGDARVFVWLSCAVSLIGFVSWGLSPTLIEVLRAHGLAAAIAITLAASTGVVQVTGRALEAVLFSTASALNSALINTVVMSLAFVLLMTAGASVPLVALFVLAYGLASGSMSVARVTLPLELFEPAAYSVHAGRLALPMTMSFAVAPPIFAAALSMGGTRAAEFVALGGCVGAVLSMLRLRAAVRARDAISAPG